MRKSLLLLILINLLVISFYCTTAYAADYMAHPEPEPTRKVERDLSGNNRTGYDDQMTRANSKDCDNCHAYQTEHTSGPHGGYTATTDKCTACHTVHKADNASLLPGTTVTGTCVYCHDLTQSEYAPYYISYLVPGDETHNIKSAHRVDGVPGLDDVMDREQTWALDLKVPGGSESDGGESDWTPSDQGKLSGNEFTCNSCHTPHAIEDTTVDPFLGESRLKFDSNGTTGRFWLTDKLLKKTVGDGSETVEQYSSDWCAACHKGRYNKEGVLEFHNHPVALLSQDAGNNALGYQFLEFASFASSGWNAAGLLDDAKQSRDSGTYETYYWSTVDPGAGKEWVLTSDPRTNRQYAMIVNDPLSSATHEGVASSDYDRYKDTGPSCQQCHGNPRDVEKTFSENLNDPNDPLTTTFPHVSTNAALTVEHGDDLCTNCHGITNLP